MSRSSRKDGQEDYTFTPVYDLVAAQHGLVTAAVYGIVHRHCRMREGVCRASTRRMAQMLGIDDVTVLRHLKVLVQAGCLEDLTPDQRHKPHVYRDVYLARPVARSASKDRDLLD